MSFPGRLETVLNPNQLFAGRESFDHIHGDLRQGDAIFIGSPLEFDAESTGVEELCVIGSGGKGKFRTKCLSREGHGADGLP